MEPNSIWDIYSTARNMLPLYPRIRNRKLREESRRIQHELLPHEGVPSFTDYDNSALTPSSTSQLSTSPLAVRNEDSKPSTSSHSKGVISRSHDQSSNSSLITPPGDSSQASVTQGIESTSSDNLVTPLSMSESPNITQVKKSKELSELLQTNLDDLLQIKNDKGLFADHDPDFLERYKISRATGGHLKSLPSVSSSSTNVISRNSETIESSSPKDSSQFAQSTWNDRQTIIPIPMHKNEYESKGHENSISQNSSLDRHSISSPSKQLSKCFNCGTTKTPLWRRDPQGNTLCNACGLFQKLHGTMRPLSLKTDIIKKRNSKRQPFNQIQHYPSNTKQFNFNSPGSYSRSKGHPQFTSHSPGFPESFGPLNNAGAHGAFVNQPQTYLMSQSYPEFSLIPNQSIPGSSTDLYPHSTFGVPNGSVNVPSYRNANFYGASQRHRNVPILPKPIPKNSQPQSNSNTPLATTPVASQSPSSFSPLSASSGQYSANQSQPQDIPRFKRLKSRNFSVSSSIASSPGSVPGVPSNSFSRRGSTPNNLYLEIQAKRGINSQGLYFDENPPRPELLVEKDPYFGKQKATKDTDKIEQAEPPDNCSLRDLDWLKFDV
ncbi:hypothetical protein OGAPHI_003531 [Ogataea philodendri]|uniref:GATA-type domain-containing protein n=1 Tax=Ogataea philodendri TaxID=1378263 RepID=A0A9P8P7S8_9ASCO|nr:uncharacterized protein OGAPHI_003531 [Ogataea philodendri]KAH3666534.1 hypothetical protein OGAPHI_003531 [Ogataea philodendri]